MGNKELKVAIDLLILKAINEENMFHRYWCIDDYYGKPSITRSAIPKELREQGKTVYAYGQYKSAYNSRKGRLIKTYKAYKSLNYEN